MAFKHKLALLGRPLGARLSAPANAEVPPASTVGPTSADATTQREATLEALRRKMAEMLGEPAAAARAPADPSRTVLPFDAVETASGTVHRRIQPQRRSLRVGRIPVDAALTASAEVLALLALDPTLAEASLARALYLDCESTGLAGAGTLAFLVGLAWFDGDRLVLEQLLLRTPADEKAVLELLQERVSRASILVTYNGKTFDVPLLAARCVMVGCPPLPKRPQLDLLHVARRLHRDRIGACRLVDVESRVLGFDRGPDIAGVEVALRYAHFLRSGEEEALRAVVDHNAHDVLTMAALVALYGERLPAIDDRDLVGLAHTYWRAKAFDDADAVAACAMERGIRSRPLRLRALIAKARGDRARALCFFEQLAQEVDDPCVRLELAKLYEHYVKEPQRALSLLDRGTAESRTEVAKRRSRLERKAWRP
ncbi:MAG: ribonuclease H-like domain-containing protein [Polyangiaceae bacterium]|nr:ribonuclease H-like domain-containing protein [Polyangiaceae bacterium]